MVLTWLTRGPPISLIPLVTLTLVSPCLPVIHTAGQLVTILLTPALIEAATDPGGWSGHWGPQPRPLG